MAKSINKAIHVSINGQEVENNIKNIRASVAQLINQQNKMTIGSKEYIETGKKIATLKGVIDEHNRSLKETGSFIDTIKKKTNEWQGAFQAVFFLSKFKNMTTSFISEYVNEFA
ncbi:MAG: hypothetical protein PHR53_02410 [Bacteroidales bacterium]|nr:hypothetical protein [Bacteroidales bacterium]